MRGLWAAFPYRLRWYRYPRVGGWGLVILYQGKRRWAIEYHGFLLRGQWVRRLHYHRGRNSSQRGKHRPWEGGW